MKEIKLTQGKFAIVDDSDFEYLNQFKWYYSCGYAQRSLPRNGKSQDKKLMHREIIEMSKAIEKDIEIDHINHNKLDNKKENLRVCTHAENLQNKSNYKNNSSGFRGVTKYKNKWLAKIARNKKTVFIGYFEDVIEAAKAYDTKALEYYGNLANLNFPK